jgi:uncharacterized protein YxjI
MIGTELATTDRYVARKAFFSLLSRSFQVYGPTGALAFQVDRQRFRVKDAMTVYTDAGRSQPYLKIQARSFFDFSATFDVTDAQTGERVGSLARQGLKSLIRDEWSVLDAVGQPLGRVVEDSGFFAILRRFVELAAMFVPESFHVEVDGQKVGHIGQRFNPFQLTYDVDFSMDRARALDRRLGIAIVVLLLAVEGRQQKEG